MKKLLSLLLVLALVFALTACTAPAESDPSVSGENDGSGSDVTDPEAAKQGGVIKIGLTQDFKNPLWLNTRDQNDFVYTNCYIETLMVFDETGAPTPLPGEERDRQCRGKDLHDCT